MKLPVWVTAVQTALSVFWCAGCGRAGTSSAMTQAQTNLTNLVAECKELSRQGAGQGKDTWSASDPLPPTIKSLSPQSVQLLAGDTATVIDIQTSGGFQHRGYLVVCESKDPNFIPSKGRGWKVVKIGPGVFTYRE